MGVIVQHRQSVHARRDIKDGIVKEVRNEVFVPMFRYTKTEIICHVTVPKNISCLELGEKDNQNALN